MAQKPSSAPVSSELPELLPHRVRSVEAPKEGYFLFREVKGGPWVPAIIRHSQKRGWWAVINGCERSPNKNPLLADKVMHIWLTAREAITRAQYEKRCAELRQPGAPPPNKAIDLNKMPPIF